MKKYDRETKKWVDSEALEKRMNERDPKLCRGKKPHDYILVLPDYVKYDSSYDFKAEEYYRLSDEKYETLERYKEKLRSMGIKEAWGWNRRESRLYMCSVCKKRKYEDPNK